MFSSIGIGDADILPEKLKKVKKIENFPLDCLGVILEFSTSTSVLNSIMLVSKGVKQYLSQNPHVTKHIKFVMTKLPEKNVVFENVGTLSISKWTIQKHEKKEDDTLTCITDDQLTSTFPNLRSLELISQLFVTDRIFEKLSSLETLILNGCPEIGNEGFKHLSKTLKKFVLDNSHYVKSPEDFRISEKVMQYLPNLEALGIHSFWNFKTDELLNLKKIRKFRSGGTRLSSRVLKVWRDLEVLELRGISSWNAKRFQYSKKIQKLRILQCRRLHKSDVKKYLKPFPEDFDFEAPRQRRGRFKRPNPLSDSEDEDSK